MVDIREARPEDKGAIEKLWADLKGSHLPAGKRWTLSSDAGERWSQHLLNHFLGERFAVAFVAVDDENVVGFVACEIRHVAPVFAFERSLHVDTLHVAASHQGRGIGRGLLERAVTWGANEGAESAEVGVGVQNEDAHTFLRKEGFVDAKVVLTRDL